MKDQGNLIGYTHILLATIINREVVAQQGEMIASDYVYNMHKAYKRVCKTFDSYSHGTLLIPNINKISIFDLRPLHYKRASWLTTRTLVQGSIFT